MRMAAITLGLLLTSAVTTPAFAGFVVGGNYNVTSLGFEGTSDDVGVNSIQARIATNISTHLGIEGRLISGINDGKGRTFDTTSNTFATFTVDPKQGFAAFLKPHAAINSAFTVYGLLGYSSQDHELTNASGDSSEDQISGFTFGVGGDIQIKNSAFSINLEYHLLNGEFGFNDVQVDVLSFGASFHF